MIWPRERFAGVLLQAGVSSALPHLAEQIAAGDPNAAPVAKQIIEAWETPPSEWSYRLLSQEPSRVEMLRLLLKLGDRTLLRRFISGAVMRGFDGSEQEALVAAFVHLGASDSAQPLKSLIRENMRWFHRPCVSLLVGILRELGDRRDAAWRDALRGAVAEAVAALPQLKAPNELERTTDWRRLQKAKPVNSEMVAGLIECLDILDAADLRRKAVDGLMRNQAIFDPATIIAPALTQIAKREQRNSLCAADFRRLWVFAAEFLLQRSGTSPVLPKNWSQAVMISCKCEDCRELQKLPPTP